MFHITDKRRTYWLINQYLSNKISTDNFCDEYYIGSLEIDSDTFTDREEKEFSQLSEIAGRFDASGEHGAHTEDDLRRKISEIKNVLWTFEHSDKGKLYDLIYQYLANQIDAYKFCDQFTICYGMEVDSNTLTKYEEEAFSGLGRLAVEFATFEEKFKKYHDIYYTEATLKQKVFEVQQVLSSSSDREI